MTIANREVNIYPATNERILLFTERRSHFIP